MPRVAASCPSGLLQLDFTSVVCSRRLPACIVHHGALFSDYGPAFSVVAVAMLGCKTDCYAGPAELSHLVPGLRSTLGSLFADSCVRMLADNRWAVCAKRCSLMSAAEPLTGSAGLSLQRVCSTVLFVQRLLHCSIILCCWCKPDWRQAATNTHVELCRQVISQSKPLSLLQADVGGEAPSCSAAARHVLQGAQHCREGHLQLLLSGIFGAPDGQHWGLQYAGLCCRNQGICAVSGVFHWHQGPMHAAQSEEVPAAALLCSILLVTCLVICHAVCKHATPAFSLLPIPCTSRLWMSCPCTGPADVCAGDAGTGNQVPEGRFPEELSGLAARAPAEGSQGTGADGGHTRHPGGSWHMQQDAACLHSAYIPQMPRGFWGYHSGACPGRKACPRLTLHMLERLAAI